MQPGDKARQLLQDPTLSVKEIAQRTGLSAQRISQIGQQQWLREQWLAIQHEQFERPVLEREIWYLPLSHRVRWYLKCADIQTIKDLMAYSDHELLKIKNFGLASLRELAAFLQTQGLMFKVSPPSQPQLPRLVYEKCLHCNGTGRTGRRIPQNK